jgi:RNA polymerase sigma factor (sigma-70 family)
LAEKETYKLLREKDKDGMATLYNRYGRKLYSYSIVHWALTEDESWDMVYKTLYKVVDSIDGYEFESEKKFGSFVFKIFINYLRNHYRDQKRVNEHLTITNFHESNLEADRDQLAPADREVRNKIARESLKQDREEEAPENPAMAALKGELDQLQDWERVLLLLRSQDMPYSEISKHINKPENQLKVYYQRLKDKITKRLQGKVILRAS